jgi:hypothetical protein
MGTSTARRRTVTPTNPISSGIPGTGRDLLRTVMARIFEKYDQAFAVWCRENGYDRDKTRAGLLGASRTPEAIAGARAAMKAAGIENAAAA